MEMEMVIKWTTYNAYSRIVIPVRVVGETRCYVKGLVEHLFRENQAQEVRIPKEEVYDTFEDAKAAVATHTLKRINSLKRELEVYERALETYQGMKEFPIPSCLETIPSKPERIVI